MITGVNTILCEVNDMDRSVSFYRDLLGLPTEIVSPYWSSLQCGGTRIGLHPRFERSSGAVGGGWILGLDVDSLAELRNALNSAGVPTGAFHDIPGGTVMDFSDPDGNRIQATQRGAKAADLA